MERTIKFRGKIACDDLKVLEVVNVEYPHSNGWVVGSFVAPNLIVGDVADIYWEFFDTEWWVQVIPETIGQFTGFKDEKGEEIYEGDVITHELFPDDVEIVKYKDGAFRAGQLLLLTYHCSVINIEGNIHDNPELFELCK